MVLACSVPSVPSVPTLVVDCIDAIRILSVPSMPGPFWPPLLSLQLWTGSLNSALPVVHL